MSDRIPYRVTAQAAVYDGITALPVSVLLENVRSMYNSFHERPSSTHARGYSNPAKMS